MPVGHVHLERSHGVARLRLDRPEVKNALSFDMCRRLVELVAELKTDGETAVLLIESAGTDFCAGADLGDLGSLLEGSPEERAEAVGRSVVELSRGIFLALAELDIPIVAAVRGWAVGAGFQLALGADLVIASETARFKAPQIALGHVPDHGESWFLPRKIGEARAARILLLGETLGAAQAEAWGLVSRLVPDAGLEEAAEDMARQLAASSRVAVGGTKALIRAAATATLREQYEAELLAVRRCAASEEFIQIIRSFARDRGRGKAA